MNTASALFLFPIVLCFFWPCTNAQCIGSLLSTKAIIHLDLDSTTECASFPLEQFNNTETTDSLCSYTVNGYLSFHADESFDGQKIVGDMTHANNIIIDYTPRFDIQEISIAMWFKLPMFSERLHIAHIHNFPSVYINSHRDVVLEFLTPVDGVRTLSVGKLDFSFHQWTHFILTMQFHTWIHEGDDDFGTDIRMFTATVYANGTQISGISLPSDVNGPTVYTSGIVVFENNNNSDIFVDDIMIFAKALLPSDVFFLFNKCIDTNVIVLETPMTGQSNNKASNLSFIEFLFYYFSMSILLCFLVRITGSSY